ncbi:DNA-directed RNA polymerase, beta subunit, partial [mine drainage metagenome]
FIIFRPTQVFRSMAISLGDPLPFKVWTRSYKEEGDRVKTSDEVVYQDKVTKFSKDIVKAINSQSPMGTMHSKSKKFYPLSVEPQAGTDRYLLLEAIPEKEVEDFYSAEDLLDPKNSMDVLLTVGQRVIEEDGDKAKIPVLTNLIQRGIFEIRCYSVPSSQRAKAVLHQTL